VGVPYRRHGRDPATGLDCVGLAALAAAAGGVRAAVPTGYGLRGGDEAAVAAVLDGAMARVPGGRGDGRAGDLVLARPGPGQLHLLVRTADGLVHADLGLGRVAERPGAVPWPVVAAWRVREAGRAGE